MLKVNNEQLSDVLFPHKRQYTGLAIPFNA